MESAHPYAQRKDITRAGGAGRTTASGRVIGRNADCLIVPIREITNGKVVGVQAINADGAKQSFGTVSDKCLLLGNTLELASPWFVAEGRASAYSMVYHHCEGNACCAAGFGKGNLEKVAHRLADVYAPLQIIILREQDA